MREGVVANMLHCYAIICFPVPPPLIPLHSLSAPSPLSLHTSLISFSSQCLLCGCGTFSTLTNMAFSYEISKRFDFLFAHTTKTTTNLNEMLLHAFTHCTCHHKPSHTVHACCRCANICSRQLVFLLNLSFLLVIHWIIPFYLT